MKPKQGVQRIETDESFADIADAFPSHEDELSLEELSAAYSKLMNATDSPAMASSLDRSNPSDEDLNDEELSANLDSDCEAGDTCVVTGKSIIEAVLFVGNPDNSGLKADAVAGMMRGVQANEVIEWIDELNRHYVEQGHVMRIVEDQHGFRMQLAPEHQSICDTLNGKLRATQLNQAAVDCLSLVAYRPGITREELERLWNRPASNILGLLVRRELLRIEREGKGKQAVTKYFPTDRFLNLIGIATLDDLPTAESEFE